MKQKQANKRHVTMIADINAHTNREILLGATEYASGKGNLDFSLEPTRGTDASAPLKIALKYRPTGLLLHNRVFPALKGHRRIRRVPCVYFSANDPAIQGPLVGLDEVAIGRMAAEHLMERGYRRLAFVGQLVPNFWSHLRGQGFCQAAREHDIVADWHELPMVLTHWWIHEAKNRNTLHRILTSLPNPCGIFAPNQTIAFFLIETALLCGIAVPERIGIIEADDDPVTNAFSHLGISSVQLPWREVGRRAAEALHLLMRGKKCPHRQLLPPTSVVVRASTDTFITEDPLLRRAQCYIEANRQRHVRIAEVIKALATTKGAIFLRFARHLNTTPADYILRRRIEQAKDLLRAGKLNVGEVSETCEFHCCSYFCQVFKSVTGVSPSSFLDM